MDYTASLDPETRIYPHLTLKALISARGVDTFWRALVLLADLDPARRSLLDLYSRTIESPVFLRTRPWEGVYRRSPGPEDYVPHEFQLWILEWPAKAVIGCAWPGLPDAFCGDEADHVERIWGINFLGRVPPVVQTVQLTQPGDGDGSDDLVEEDVPGLVAWQLFDDSWVWVILDERPILRGKVYDIQGTAYDK
ncbi:hypothetical protein C8R46DRAFT_1041611 [Mycena filopes]|nr:hypothetical protein C8R46DRAFT_1041611 [Mycena filopes]